jgi:hypothetical protein
VLFVKIWWQNVCYLLRSCLCLNIVLYLLFKGHTPLHLAAWKGKTEVVDLLLKSGASLSVMNNEVIKPLVKLRHSNINSSSTTSFYSWNRKCLEFYDVTKKNMIWWQPLTAWTKIYKKSFIVRNIDKIYIFWFSWITRLKQDATRHIWYFIFCI